LYLYVRQVEDSENICGVLSVFVKALPYTHIIFTDKLQFILSYNIAMSDIIILLTDSLADSHSETTK
ncbi:hypothetical protein, partial [uncultured Prevotella sp.]|uniref:hypothetical protein n=1 Tax=uncultured Prevotella sp. TaxID=159272 RepID=UPI00262E546D